jgi:hypothetical protein
MLPLYEISLTCQDALKRLIIKVKHENVYHSNSL